ncbi:hypothetical protein [Paenibacillus tundrae]|uniref:hypothetical protein n=1 Tax=Paenibacillus tundrae TaxID=528187 RepID=UPI0030CFD041
MNDSISSKVKLGLSCIAALLIGTYIYPILTLTSLYASGSLPYTLLFYYIITAGLAVLVQQRFPRLGSHAFYRSGVAIVLGAVVFLITNLTLSLPWLELYTVGVWGIISAYIGLTSGPYLRSTATLRLQLVGVSSSILLSVASSWGEPFHLLQPYVTSLYVSGVICFAGWMITLYSSQMDRAILNDSNRRLVLREFARANRQRLMWILITIGLIGAFPSLAAWLGPLRDRLLAWIRGLLNTSGQETPIPPAEPMNTPMLPEQTTEGNSEPSILWDILGWVVLIAVILVILWFTMRWGQGALHRLMERLKGMMNSKDKKMTPPTEYMDISETLAAPTRVRKPWFRKKEPLPTQDRDRIRFYYRKWINSAARSGVHIEGSQTPLETGEIVQREGSKQGDKRLSTILPDAYNAVRYGKKAPDTDKMNELDQIWKS